MLLENQNLKKLVLFSIQNTIKQMHLFLQDNGDNHCTLRSRNHCTIYSHANLRATSKIQNTHTNVVNSNQNMQHASRNTSYKKLKLGQKVKQLTHVVYCIIERINFVVKILR